LSQWKILHCIDTAPFLQSAHATAPPRRFDLASAEAANTTNDNGDNHVHSPHAAARCTFSFESMSDAGQRHAPPHKVP